MRSIMDTIRKAQNHYARAIIKGKVPVCELPRTLEDAQAYLADETKKRTVSHQQSIARRESLIAFLDELLGAGEVSQEEYDRYSRHLPMAAGDATAPAAAGR